VFAIGTGHQTRPYLPDAVRQWGLVDWVKPSNALPLLSIMMHGQASSASYQAHCLLNRPDAAARYARIDMQLETCMDELDDASPTNLACLEQLARASATSTEGTETLDQVVDWLVRRAAAKGTETPSLPSLDN
jgi:uncharacterized protein